MSNKGIQSAQKKITKPSYKHLTQQEKKLIKIYENYVLSDKFLYGHYGFYARCNRLSNNSVDWNSIDNKTMICFEKANKQINKYLSCDKDKLDKALNIFRQTQPSFSSF